MGVLPPTTYEQRESLYQDLRELITNGFLSHKCRLGDSTIAIRNLSQADNFYIKHCMFDESDDTEWMLWTISRSIWMFDGLILLGEKNYAYHIFHKIKGLPKKVISRIFKLVVSLTKKSNDQYSRLEAFTYEESSRSLWAQCRHLSLPSDRISGIQGSETLGINLAQRLWVSINTYRDEILRERREWNNAKFIASAQSPKGVEKINQKEKSAYDQDEARKKRFLDEFYYRQVGVLTDDTDKDKLKHTVVKTASTPDELEEEMRKWVSGEVDDHDSVVLAYKNRIKQMHEEEMYARQQRLEEVKRELEEEGAETITLSPLIGYTNDQLKDILSQKGHSPDGRKISTVMYQDQSIKLYSKHIDQQAESGKLKVRDGKIVVKGEDNSLMEDVAKRTVKGGVKDNE